MDGFAGICLIVYTGPHQARLTVAAGGVGASFVGDHLCLLFGVELYPGFFRRVYLCRVHVFTLLGRDCLFLLAGNFVELYAAFSGETKSCEEISLRGARDC